MAYVARGSYHHHSFSTPHKGGSGQGAHRPTKSSDNYHRRPKAQPAVIQGTGDIFTSESPKAYAPLGYNIPPEPIALRPEDYNNDTPLPKYPLRPPQVIKKPLGSSFVDTENQRPIPATGLSKKQVSRDNSNDPVMKIVQKNTSKKTPLMLGKNIITESNSTAGGTVYLEKILKRDREHTTEPEDGEKEPKKQKKELRIKFEGEDEADINEDTVKPENVLRMVDSSLVDNTPEKKYPQRPHSRQQSVDTAAVYADSRYVIRGNPPIATTATTPAVSDYYRQYPPYEDARIPPPPPQAPVPYDYYTSSQPPPPPPPSHYYPPDPYYQQQRSDYAAMDFRHRY